MSAYNKTLLILTLILLVVIPVYGETGIFGSETGSLNVTNVSYPENNAGSFQTYFNRTYLPDIQVYRDIQSLEWQGYCNLGSLGATPLSTSFNVFDEGTSNYVGSGTITATKINFNTVNVKYTYNDFSAGALTGGRILRYSFDQSQIGNIYAGYDELTLSVNLQSPVLVAIGGKGIDGAYSTTFIYHFRNDWAGTLDQNGNLSLSVMKTFGSENYASSISIKSLGTTIFNDGATMNTSSLFITTSNNPVMINCTDPRGNHYSSGYIYGINQTALTINVKSTTTGLNIPRAAVTLYATATQTIVGETDLEGNFTYATLDISYQPKTAIISKAGYNTSITNFTSNAATYFHQVYLNDIVLPPGAPATVYLDVAKLSDGGSIGGATVGIQNTTATIDQWYYNTYAESSIPFNTTGTPPGINLSVGQTVVFSGYKTGEYVANNTGSYVIPSKLSHVTLYLKPVSGNTSATYQYPVNVVDSTTGYTISGSYLNVTTLLDTDGGFNSSSASGKFNVTGHGTNMHIPLISGDVLVLTGYAPGYNTWYIMVTVSDSTNGVLQNVPLDPSGIQPLVNQSTLIFSVYDAQTSQALSNVAVKIGSTTVATNSAGNAAFYNVTALKNTYTVSKSGYTTQTGIANAVLGQIVAINVGMSPSSVNPTVTVTTTPPFTNLPVTTAPNGSYSGFWAPIEHGFSAAGASSLEMGILMAGLLVIVGVIVGGFAAASVIPGAAFSTTGGLAGGVFGLLAAIAFGFIPLIYIIVLIFVLVFAAVMMRS